MNKTVLSIALVAPLLASCAQYQKAGMTQAQFERDFAECEYEKSKVGGYDWIDASIQRGKVFELCMKMKNYSLSYNR